MKASDFNMQSDLKFDLATGITSFKDTRLIIFDANAIGLLRQKIIENIGLAQARAMFLQFGYQNGYADFLQMKLNYSFDSEIELMASGPVIHTWEGIVQATIKEIQFDRTIGEFFVTGVWKNSYEALQHLMFNQTADEPVCWSLMGYASGWSSAFFGAPVIAIETMCVGKGDSVCEWKIQPPSKWGAEAEPYIAALKVFQGGN